MSDSSSARTDSPLLILVDGHSLAFRSYYAHAKGWDGGLRTSTGIPTSVCYGFLKSLIDMLEKEEPSHVAIDVLRVRGVLKIYSNSSLGISSV